VDDPNPTSASPVPGYLIEIRELAKLRDEGIITSQDFDLKKAQLLGLSSPQSATAESAPLQTKSLIEMHCERVLAAAVLSPSSTRVSSSIVFPSPRLPEDLRFAIQDCQLLEAQGTTVAIEYDSANAYGAMIPGRISCDYTEPHVSPTELEVSLRLVLIDGDLIQKDAARVLAITATLDLAGEIFAYQEQLKKSEA
jgi:hypothetical protein